MGMSNVFLYLGEALMALFAMCWLFSIKTKEELSVVAVMAGGCLIISLMLEVEAKLNE